MRQYEKIVLMHEIGHDRLHRDKADDCGGFAEYDIFDMCDRSMEYEANLFAAQFLISDEELYDCINCGYDIDKLRRHSAPTVILLRSRSIF